MSDLFGFTRDVIKERYALRTPAGFVPSVLPGWKDAVCIIQISPQLGANFCQFLITLEPSGEGRGLMTAGLEQVVYVLAGSCEAKIDFQVKTLATGAYVYLPPEAEFHFHKASKGTQLLVFQKRYQALTGTKMPAVIVGHEKEIIGQPFLGNDGARLQILLPDTLEFDMAVNIFTYQPGATLPFVESHIMEHGLVMLAGQGVYRLDADYHPVQAGDAIWMAPYCPQWFVAMGKTPASYLYYKDVNRMPLA